MFLERGHWATTMWFVTPNYLSKLNIRLKDILMSLIYGAAVFEKFFSYQAYWTYAQKSFVTELQINPITFCTSAGVVARGFERVLGIYNNISLNCGSHVMEESGVCKYIDILSDI